MAMLPLGIERPLRRQLERVRELHVTDLGAGFGAVWLPDAVARKYPNAPQEWGWPYVFPAAKRSEDPRNGTVRRHHDIRTVQELHTHVLNGAVPSIGSERTRDPGRARRRLVWAMLCEPFAGNTTETLPIGASFHGRCRAQSLAKRPRCLPARAVERPSRAARSFPASSSASPPSCASFPVPSGASDTRNWVLPSCVLLERTVTHEYRATPAVLLRDRLRQDEPAVGE
jgi:hypothetical protein